MINAITCRRGIRSRVRLTIGAISGCTVALGFVLCAVPSAGQSVDEQTRFEVASIKLHVASADATAGIDENESSVRIRNLPLRAVISMAYQVPAIRVAGPSSIDGRTFDIVAKPPSGYRRSQLPLALRNLLAERFGLVAHLQKRDVQGYALRVANSGSRLKPSTEPRTFLTGRSGLISGNSRSIGDLVNLLAQMVAVPVVDETEMAGVYDIKLEWTPQLTASVDVRSGEPEVSIFTALREQLGLQLQATTTPADFVVVDRVAEMPTPD